jgi:hypothetical protein
MREAVGYGGVGCGGAHSLPSYIQRPDIKECETS